MRRVEELLYVLSLLFAVMMFSSCTQNGINNSIKENEGFKSKCQRLSNTISMFDVEMSKEDRTIGEYMGYINNLSAYLTSDDTVGVEKSRLDSLLDVSKHWQEMAMIRLNSKWLLIDKEEDKLVTNEKIVYPVRLYKGDELKVVVGSTQKLKSVVVKEYKTDDIVASDFNKQDIEIVAKARVASIYLVSIEVSKQSYVDYKILRKAGKKENLTLPTNVQSKTVECNKGERGAYAQQEVEMRNIYEEPFKATLASQGRAIFGNKSRSMASVQLPKGSTGFFYRLRLSSSKEDRYSDGNLSSELVNISRERSVGSVKYSHNTKVSSPFVSSVLSSLSSPNCEEEIYCNMYVIKGAKYARKFQDQKGDFLYNLDNSKQNTQSTNGYVPSEGLTSFYIGLDNSRFTTSIYVWLEVVAAVPTTKYYKVVYE